MLVKEASPAVLHRTLRHVFVTVQASVLDDDWYEAQVSTMAHSRLYPNFWWLPQIMNEISPQSRSAIAKGVPSKADNELLSKIAWSALTPTSGASSKPELPRRNHGLIASGLSTRCQAIA